MMKFPEILESWRYQDPCLIGDGLIARSERMTEAQQKQETKQERPRKDRHYTKSRSLRIRALVKLAKRGGLKHGN